MPVNYDQTISDESQKELLQQRQNSRNKQYENSLYQPKIKSNLRVYLIAASSVLGSFFFGYSLSYMNVSLDTVNIVFGISQQQDIFDGLISSFVPIGAAVGALISGPILVVFSRKNSMILTDIIGVGGVAFGLIVNIYTLLVARFIVGIAAGLNSTLVPLYIKEYTPTHMRGIAGSFTQVTVNIGILVPLIIGLGYPENPPNGSNHTNYWKIVFLIPIIPCILRTLILLFIYRWDPPIYYVSIGDENKALEVLSQIYEADHKEEQLNELKTETITKQGKQGYSDLIKPIYRKRLIIGCLLGVLQQFSGINAVIFYSTRIFQSITDKIILVKILNIAVGLTNIIFSMAAGFLLRNYGRKKLLFLGDLLCFLSLGALTLFSFLYQYDRNQTYQILIIVFLFLFIIGFQLSLGPIPWIYLAETLPEKGVSIAILTVWISTFVVTFIFLELKALVGIAVCFLIFSGFCLLGLILIHFFVIETRLRRGVSIERMFNSKYNINFELERPEIKM